MDKKSYWTRFISTLSSLLFFLIGNCYSLDLYVSKNGNDSNPGTASRPLATLEAAQKKIRSIHEPVVVYVRAGTYYLKKPSFFRQKIPVGQKRKLCTSPTRTKK